MGSTFITNTSLSDGYRLEQFVFDTRNPDSVKQLEWVARRVEVPPSPPQTPPRPSGPEAADLLLARDPFRSPVVLTKRWSDYDDDDESLGSPMSLPITPESSSDVPALDLGGCSDGSDVARGRRAPTAIIAVPTLSDRWLSMNKTVLPIPRLSLFTPEIYPQLYHTTSLNPMKLESSHFKQMPGASTSTAGGAAVVVGQQRKRARLEHWVREDAERRLKAKHLLSSTARKKAELEAENIVYNRMAAVAGLNTGEMTYAGEPDLLGLGRGISLDDVRDIVAGRFREKTVQVDEGEGESEGGGTKVMLVPSAEGWICRHMDES